MSKKGWPPERVQRLRELAATGLHASAIAIELGVGHMGVLIVATKHNIPVQRYTPEELAAKDAHHKKIEHEKYLRWRKRHNMPAVAVKVTPGTSQSSPIYRKQLPPIGEMSKDRLRAMIADAVRNTAEMQINA